MADQYQEARDARLELQRQTDKLKEVEDELKASLLAVLQEQGVGGVAGKKYRVTLVCKPIAVVEDWSKVYDYIKANDAFDIIQPRLSAPAVRERQAEGPIPGIGSIDQFTLGLNKL